MACRARVHDGSGNCLCFRGIIPGKYSAAGEGPRIHDARIWVTEGYSETLSATGAAHTDGSGGPMETPAALRKASFGSVCFYPDISDGIITLSNLQFMVGEVPGKLTAPRA